MRRYGQTTDRVTVPGVDAGLKLTLQPAVVAAAPCQPIPTGLYWFSDLTGDFTEVAEAAYVLPPAGDPPVADSVSAVLGLARVLGETCDAVEWHTAWTPDEDADAPRVAELGATLAVYPAATGGPGVLTVTAVCAGQPFGPISLTLAKKYCGPDIRGLCVWKTDLGGHMAYHATCHSEITIAFPSDWDGRLFFQIDGILTPDCYVSWSWTVSDGMDSFFRADPCGFADAFLMWILFNESGPLYPISACNVTVTATVTCNGEEIGVFTAVAILLEDEE